jgi:hypothetical protein
LLESEWSKWKIFREARNTSSHSYNEQKSLEVMAVIPTFLSEAQYLYKQLSIRENSLE